MKEVTKDNVFKEDDEQTYRMFNYMEQHHSFFIALVSASVAVGTLAIYILIYVFQCVKLQVCNIPIEIIGQVKQGKYFYVAIIGTIFYCFMPLCYEYLREIFGKVYKLYTTTKFQRKIIKKIYKIDKKKRNNDLKRKMLILKRDVRKCEKSVIMLAVDLFAIVTVIFSILYLLFQVSMVKINFSSIIVILIVSPVMIYVLCVHLKKEYKNNLIKELKEKYKNENKTDKLLDMLEDICELQTTVVSDGNKNKDFKHYLSDQRISEYIHIVISSFVAVCIVFLLHGVFLTRFNDGYWMYKDETGQYYAIVYQNEEQVILEEAYIEGDTICINNDKQMFMKYEDNKFEYIEFEDVKYCDDYKSFVDNAN